MTFTEFAEKNNLVLELSKVPFRADIENDVWDKSASHYAFIIKVSGYAKKNQYRDYKGFYSQGSGVKNPPTIEDILNSLQLDTNNLDGASFKDWADDYGYNPDSIKDRSIYEACLKEREQLKYLFTNEQLTEFYQCESL